MSIRPLVSLEANAFFWRDGVSAVRDPRGREPSKSIRPTMKFWMQLLACGLLAIQPCRAGERQHHGVAFEKWVRDTFFDGYAPVDYTQKWDIPAEANTRHGGIPVNPKAVKYGSAVDLGDALRQFDINQPFWLILGCWRQEGDQKRMVNITATRVDPARWRAMWGPVTRTDIESLDALIKDRSLPLDEVRRQARQRKASRLSANRLS